MIMKKINNLLGITALLMILGLSIIASCKKEKPPGKISVYTSSDLKVGSINVSIDGSFKGVIAEGDYLLTTPQCNSSLCLNSEAPSESSFLLKAVANDGSEWTFNEQVPNGGCEIKELNLANRSKIPVPVNQKGEVIFWESTVSGCSSDTYVTINGQTNSISSYSSSVPDCGASGCATFSLNPGTYTYSASSSACSGTKTGTISIIANQCTPVQLMWSGTTNSGYNCVNGNCVFTNSNAQYSTLSGCQSACSGPITSGYNCVSGNCIFTSNNAQYSTLPGCQTACSSNSSITFQNNSFTSIEITFNGITQTIPPGGTAVFYGTPGTLATGTAETSGNTSSGTQVGSKLIWNLSTQFPSSGNATTNLNVGSDWFFIKIKNNGTKPLENFYVNYGLQSQTLDNITIPNNNQGYNIGYYKAWSNSNVRTDLQGTSQYVTWYQGTNFTLPFTINQVANLTNTYLMEIGTDK